MSAAIGARSFIFAMTSVTHGDSIEGFGVREADRGAVFDRFRELVQLPAEVSRDEVVHRDPRAIDQCWNALDLQNTGWWRGWERKWSE